MTTREISFDDALKLIQNGGLLGAPVRLSTGEWGAELRDENHTSAEADKIVLITTSKGTRWDAILVESVFTSADGSVSHWRVVPCANIPKDSGEPRPEVFQGSPSVLPDGSWGVKVITSHTINVGDTIEVTSRRGSKWVTNMVEQVGENLYKTTGKSK